MIECLYDAFMSAAGNTENYIDYLVIEDFKYKTEKKTFDCIYNDIIKCCGELKNSGVGSDSTVAFEIENTYDCLIVDSALIMLGAQAIISRKNDAPSVLDERIAEFKAEFVISDRNSDAVSALPHTTVSSLRAGGNSSYVPERHIYTKDMSVMFSSGTTGTPKALGITEEGSVWSSDNFFEFMHFNSGDKFLIFMPLSNYQQRFLFWGCLMNKVNISIGDDMTLPQCLTYLEPSILLAPPNYFYNLYCQQKSSDTDVIKSALGKNMRYLLTGMAPIDNEILFFFSEYGNEIYQIYGQTEVGMICCNTTLENKIGKVGKPIIDIELTEDGELITNSPHPIVSGYYENGKLGSLMPKKRSTGDMAVMDEDGFVSVIGRINDTIILNSGKKINPAMIENKIKNICTDSEAVIFKTKENNSFMINIVIISENIDNIDTDSVKNSISKMSEINAFTDSYKVEFMKADKKTLAGLYTENGKFSRKKAVDMLLSM